MCSHGCRGFSVKMCIFPLNLKKRNILVGRSEMQNAQLGTRHNYWLLFLAHGTWKQNGAPFSFWYYRPYLGQNLCAQEKKQTHTPHPPTHTHTKLMIDNRETHRIRYKSTETYSDNAHMSSFTCIWNFEIDVVSVPWNCILHCE